MEKAPQNVRLRPFETWKQPFLAHKRRPEPFLNYELEALNSEFEPFLALNSEFKQPPEASNLAR
jgi:hypothetical protein